MLTYVSEQGEVRWGIASEAEGLALTIAEFTDIHSLSVAPDSAPLERVAAFGQARGIAISSLDGNRMRQIVSAGEDRACVCRRRLRLYARARRRCIPWC